ncbi:GTPase Era [Enterobacterales bacterium endosymbiont of Anomoneura mori]|uniref:GTPase Era n=1 Tax=Enterobacterales bacterium endosymbiont of Anomoneura mori TaxID=3132096 RepID=UPI00399CB959
MKENINYFVSIIGRTNVGKSTLLNKLINKKISITSKKKNTTINNILGIYKKNNYQIIYIDNPGYSLYNNFLNIKINNNLYDLDIIIYIIEGTILKNDDKKIIKKLKSINSLIILVINKIDIIKNKIFLLPFINYLKKKINFFELIPISAKYNINLNIIKNTIFKILNNNNKNNNNSNINNNFNYINNYNIIEIIREKIIRYLGQELPYCTKIKIENITFINNKYNFFVLILVNKKSQKKIIIGKNGNKIKTIGTISRLEIEKKIKKKINLFLKVIVE